MNVTEVPTTNDLPKGALYRTADDPERAIAYAEKHDSPAVYYVLTNKTYYVLLVLERENV